MQREVLAVRKRVQGADHPDTLAAQKATLRRLVSPDLPQRGGMAEPAGAAQVDNPKP